MIRNFSKIRSLRQFTVDSQEVQIVTQSTIRQRSDSLTTFLIDVSQNPIVQRQIRHNLLELRIVMLQLLQTPNFQHRHAAEFVPPAIESLFAGLVFPADIQDRDVAFRLL